MQDVVLGAATQAGTVWARHTCAMDDMSTARFFASPDGTRLSYLDKGAGPAVVLLHALTANWQANWVETGVVEQLVRAGYRTIAPDARGHGRSEAPDAAADAAYHPDVLAEDAAALVKLLEIEPVSIIGYSYGARTAAQLAAAGEIELRSVVLGGVAMSSLTPISSGAETDAILAAVQADDQAVAGDESIVAMRARMATWNARVFAVAAIYGALRDAGPIDLDAITVPVLVVNSPMEPDDVVASIPGARSVTIGGDHLTAPLDPAFAATIIAFLEETNPVGPRVNRVGRS